MGYSKLRPRLMLFKVGKTPRSKSQHAQGKNSWLPTERSCHKEYFYEISDSSANYSKVMVKGKVFEKQIKLHD
jgi:hypothetical protein